MEARTTRGKTACGFDGRTVAQVCRRTDTTADELRSGTSPALSGSAAIAMRCVGSRNIWAGSGLPVEREFWVPQTPHWPGASAANAADWPAGIGCSASCSKISPGFRLGRGVKSILGCRACRSFVRRRRLDPGLSAPAIHPSWRCQLVVRFLQKDGYSECLPSASCSADGAMNHDGLGMLPRSKIGRPAWCRQHGLSNDFVRSLNSRRHLRFTGTDRNLCLGQRTFNRCPPRGFVPNFWIELSIGIATDDLVRARA